MECGPARLDRGYDELVRSMMPCARLGSEADAGNGGEGYLYQLLIVAADPRRDGMRWLETRSSLVIRRSLRILRNSAR
jgi:hypothetical protein